MTDSTDSATVTPAEDDDALRKRLLSRIAVAGVAIVGLLGGLAVFDSLNRPQAPAMPPMAAVPAATTEPSQEEKKATDEEAPVVAEKAEEEKPVEQAEAGTPAQTAAADPVPEKSETPLGPPVAEKPLQPAKPVTPPATARQATTRPSQAATTPARPDPQQEIVRTVPEGTSSPYSPQSRSQAASRTQQQQAINRHAPASRPLSQAAETARRFLVQVGVFSNHTNAEELMQKLHEAGIPAQIESRVQVGPFASRMEADAARAKLKAMGLDEGLLVRR
ncbi:MAG: SPOR domain-containing protein [Rhodocyclaceae bacterium]|nr:SPOR domain-containing protein [Rhodocyclaceae bacterium]MDZ4215796.1 SPOR domain-containing protein [Rhodocyclaceae bacterium]